MKYQSLLTSLSLFAIAQIGTSAQIKATDVKTDWTASWDNGGAIHDCLSSFSIGGDLVPGTELEIYHDSRLSSGGFFNNGTYTQGQCSLLIDSSHEIRLLWVPGGPTDIPSIGTTYHVHVDMYKRSYSGAPIVDLFDDVCSFWLYPGMSVISLPTGASTTYTHQQVSGFGWHTLGLDIEGGGLWNDDDMANWVSSGSTVIAATFDGSTDANGNYIGKTVLTEGDNHANWWTSTVPLASFGGEFYGGSAQKSLFVIKKLGSIPIISEVSLNGFYGIMLSTESAINPVGVDIGSELSS